MKQFKTLSILIFLLGLNISALGQAQLKIPIQKISGVQEYTPRGPIAIIDNTQFISMGFPGSGTSNDPFRIEGYNISASSGPLISISGTTAHFRIMNNFLNGLNQTPIGIELVNVIHGAIQNNIVGSNIEAGIRITSYVINSSFSNNTIHGCPEGISLINSCNNNTVVNNAIYDCQTGISLWGSSNNVIRVNYISNTSQDGIWMDDYHDGTAYLFSDDNIIYNNIFTNINGYGIHIGAGASNNLVTYNNFNVAPFRGFSQAFDAGTMNTFTYNFWSDWTTPDVDTNFIVDNPYAIDGMASNSDPSPIVIPNEIGIIQIQTIAPGSTIPTIVPETYEITLDASIIFILAAICIIIIFLIVCYILWIPFKRRAKKRRKEEIRRIWRY